MKRILLWRSWATSTKHCGYIKHVLFYAALQPPSNVSIYSANMNHTLSWKHWTENNNSNFMFEVQYYEWVNVVFEDLVAGLHKMTWLWLERFLLLFHSLHSLLVFQKNSQCVTRDLNQRIHIAEKGPLANTQKKIEKWWWISRVVHGTYLSVPFPYQFMPVPSNPIPWDVSHGIPIGMTFPWTTLGLSMEHIYLSHSHPIS